MRFKYQDQDPLYNIHAITKSNYDFKLLYYDIITWDIDIIIWNNDITRWDIMINNFICPRNLTIDFKRKWKHFQSSDLLFLLTLYFLINTSLKIIHYKLNIFHNIVINILLHVEKLICYRINFIMLLKNYFRTEQ